MKATLFSDFVDEWELSLKSNAFAAATVRSHMATARRLLAHVGNVQMRNITPRHIDTYFAERQVRLSPASLNIERSALNVMFGYAMQRRYITENPAAHRRMFRKVKRERTRVPARDFPALLDCAHHPQDRVIVALGLFLFLRASEIRTLRVGDVDLGSGLIEVEVHKTKQFDVMPISSELDAELRRWLTWYGTQLGRPLKRTDYLVPTKDRPRFVKGVHPRENADLQRIRVETVLNPERPVYNPAAAVQRVLSAYGIAIRDDNDESLREGVHTLRRSGARALFDRLLGEGYDGALRTVQAMLHHAAVTTTEVYLGIALDKKRRDDILRGKSMFPADNSNVVELKAVDSWRAHG